MSQLDTKLRDAVAGVRAALGPAGDELTDEAIVRGLVQLSRAAGAASMSYAKALQRVSTTLRRFEASAPRLREICERLGMPDRP